MRFSYMFTCNYLQRSNYLMFMKECGRGSFAWKRISGVVHVAESIWTARARLVLW